RIRDFRAADQRGPRRGRHRRCHRPDRDPGQAAPRAGNLLPKIRDAYRAEQIDDETVRHLTLASPSQQRKWLRLFSDPKQYAPRGFQLKQWLFGGQQIATSHALFKLTDYTGQTIEDLFGEDSYFA